MIKVKNLTKSLDNNLILDKFTLNIEKGKTTLILGESGCGKTVFLKHIVGLLKADSGKIFFEGDRIDNASKKSLRKFRKKATMIFQKPALFDWLTVYENVALPLREKNVLSKTEIDSEVEEKLRIVGLEKQKHKKPDEISLGMQKRVSIARALALKPEYILFDEPTTGLDPIIAKDILDLFLKMKQEYRTTIVIVSHDIGIVFKIADNVAMMKHGKIIFSDNVKNFERSENKYIKQFHSR